MYGIIFKFKNVLTDNIILYKKRIIIVACLFLLAFVAGVAVGTTLDGEKFTPILKRIGDEKSVISVFFARTLPILLAIILFSLTQKNNAFYLCAVFVCVATIIIYGVGFGKIIGGFSFCAFVSLILALLPFAVLFFIFNILTACLYETHAYKIAVCGFDLFFYCCLTVLISIINIAFYVVLLWLFSLFF